MWVLIVIMLSTNGSIAMTTAEFSSKVTCQAALTTIQGYQSSQDTDGGTGITLHSSTDAFCTEK